MAAIAVISSAMMGTVSGSTVANVTATGSITIPLMKMMGFKPQYAGSVEAVSSAGGSITPPVYPLCARAPGIYGPTKQ